MRYVNLSVLDTCKKTCSRCGTARDQKEFQKEPRNYDGLRSHCKICQKELTALYRKAQPKRKRGQYGK